MTPLTGPPHRIPLKKDKAATYPERILWATALLMALLFEGLTLHLWLGIDTRPPAWDESIHLSVALDYAEALKQGHWQRVLEPAYFNYPPLYHLSLAPVFFHRAHSRNPKQLIRAAIECNWFYLTLLAFGLFLIGNKLAGPAQGFAAGVFGTAAPFITEISHYPLTDLALSAWVAWAFYALIESEHFSRWIPTLFFGLLCGIGMLTKWSFFVYTGAPALIMAFFPLKRGNLFRAFIALLLCLGLSLPWYLPNAIPVFTRVVGCTRMGVAEGDQAVGSLASWLYYPQTAFLQFHLGLSLLVLIGLLASMMKRRTWVLWVWAFLPMLFFSLISNKDFRYSTPCLGALALMASLAFSDRWRVFLVYACLGVLLGHFYDCFGEKSRTYSWQNLEIPLTDPHPPHNEDWKQSEIARFCLIHRDRGDPLTEVSTIENHPYLHSMTLNLNARLEGFRHVVFRGKAKRLGELSQFILTKTGDLGPAYSLGQIPEVAKSLFHPEPWFRHSFSKAGEWGLPDGSAAVIFEREVRPIRIHSLKKLEWELGKLSFPNIKTKGLKIKLEVRTQQESARGLFKRIDVLANSLEFRGLPFNNVRLVLTNAQIDWPLFLSKQEIRLLRLQRAQVQMTIPRYELQAFAAKKIRHIEDLTIEFRDGLKAQASVAGMRVGVDETIIFDPAKRTLSFHLAGLSVAGVPLPLAKTILSPFTNRTISLNPNPELPFFIDLHSLDWKPDGLHIQ